MSQVVSKVKRSLVFDLFKWTKLHIVFLQEMHLIGFKDVALKYPSVAYAFNASYSICLYIDI